MGRAPPCSPCSDSSLRWRASLRSTSSDPLSLLSPSAPLHLPPPSVCQLPVNQSHPTPSYATLRHAKPQDPIELEARAFVWYYMSSPDIPEELQNNDDDVKAACEELRKAQESFKETHKAYARLRKERKDPASVKLRIEEQGREKQQLADRVEQIKNKVTGKMSPGELAPLKADAERITRAQENAEGIKLSMDKQRAWLDEQKQRNGSTAARLRELKGIAQSGSAEALIRQLKEEVTQLR